MSSYSQLVPEQPTDHFDNEQWKLLTELLRKLELGFRTIASKRHVEIKGDSRWPSLYFVRSRFLRRRSVTFRLVSEYFQDKEVRWEVAVEEIDHAWVFFYRLLNHQIVANFTVGEAQNIERIGKVVDQVVGDYLEKWRPVKNSN